MESTKDHILEAAESLFADHGFEGVSVREITQAAGANTAAVNYYFGTKHHLYLEVLRRHVLPINAARLNLLDEAKVRAGANRVPVREILEALLLPLIDAMVDGGRVNLRLMKLANRIQTESPDVLFEMEKEFVEEIFSRFLSALTESLPELAPEEIQVRFFLAVGTLFGSMGQCSMRWLSAGDDMATEEYRQIMCRLIDFVTAGFMAPARINRRAE